MAPHTPVFPLELFAGIIERLSEECPGRNYLSEEQMAALCACSLTCRSLLELSRREIFRYLPIHFQKRAGGKLLRLLDAIEAEPLIKTYIKEVRVYFWRVDADPSQFEYIQQHKEAPSKFPAVQSLSISDGYFYTEGGRFMRRPDRLPAWIQGFCKNLIDSYVSLPTLRSLNFVDNARSHHLPYIALRCPTVSELRLVNIRSSPDPELSSFVIPPLDHLKSLMMDNCSHLLLPIPTNSKSLSNLTLRGLFEKLGGLPPAIFKLSTLVLEPDEREEAGLAGTIQLLWANNRLGFKPISWLTDFSVGIVVPADVAIVNSMLEDLHHLRSLAIDVPLSKTDKSFSFADLELDRHLQVSFPSLTSISISFWHDSDSPVISTFIAVIPSISATRGLRHITLKLSMSIALVDEDDKSESESDSSEPERGTESVKQKLALCDDTLFSSLMSILSGAKQFENLERLEIILHFGGRTFNSADDEPIGALKDDEFLPQLSERIQELEQKNGVLLHSNFTEPVTSYSSWRRPRVMSRCALIKHFPKQSKALKSL